MAEVRLGRYADTLYPCVRDAEADLRCAAYAVGTQGTGKSTLLANLAEQFTAAGEGVLVVDIKGELAEDIAARTRHVDRLVYVAPGENVFPSGRRYWALNPFEFDRSQPHLEDVAVANLLSLFERMGLVRLDTMVQVRQLLQMSARLALALPRPTLPDLLQILSDASLRSRLLADPAVPPAVRRFWESYRELTPHQQREKATSTVPRLNEFLSSTVVDRLVSPRRSTVRLAEWLDAGKLVVCNLGTNLAQEISRLLGNFVVANLVNAAYARPTANEARVRTWRVIVDEFHELAGPQFAELITQARKYRVFPVIAHQNLAQLGDGLTNAVISCPLRFFLAVSAEDRLAIRRLFGDATAAGLANLPRFQARVHLREGAEGVFRQETLKLPGWWAERDPGQLQRVIATAEDDRFTLPAEHADPLFARWDGVSDNLSDAMEDDAASDTGAFEGIEKTAVAMVGVTQARINHEVNDGSGQNGQRPARRIIDEFAADGSEAAGAADQRRSKPDAALSPQTRPAGGGDAGRARPARILDEFAGR